jgi:hypothetical protein
MKKYVLIKNGRETDNTRYWYTDYIGERFEMVQDTNIKEVISLDTSGFDKENHYFVRPNIDADKDRVGSVYKSDCVILDSSFIAQKIKKHKIV